jgi:hypothetical protein
MTSRADFAVWHNEQLYFHKDGSVWKSGIGASLVTLFEAEVVRRDRAHDGLNGRTSQRLWTV